MFTEGSAKQVRRADCGSGIVVHGISHHRAAVELREQLAVAKSDCSEVLDRVMSHDGVREAVVLSTCNRTEVVTALRDPDSDVSPHIAEVFESISGVARAAFLPALYTLTDREAIGHVFRVAAGLDSMMLGEPQILGQIKDAYRSAQSQGTTQVLLNKLFHRAFTVAKAVRTKTRIGRNAVSICYAAKELAEQIFGDLQEASVLLIGAGETGTLAVKHFQSAGARELFIANKTLSRAAELAEKVGAVAFDLTNIDRMLSKADIIIGAASLPAGSAPLVDRRLAQEALRERPGLTQFFIDLAVPRNFEPAIGELSDVFLYNIDDLQAVVSSNIDSRQMELRRAEVIVDEEVAKFIHWLEFRSAATPAILEVQQHLYGLKEREIEKTLRRFRREGLSDPQEQERVESALRDLCDAMLSKVLHRPFESLRSQLQRDAAAVEIFRDYFVQEQKDSKMRRVK